MLLNYLVLQPGWDLLLRQVTDKQVVGQPRRQLDSHFCGCGIWLKKDVFAVETL